MYFFESPRLTLPNLSLSSVHLSTSKNLEKKKKKSKIKPFASKKAKALADKNNLSGKDFPEMEKVGVKDVREKINS